MKIVVTGSLGRISKPLTEALVQKGHSVILISSKPERKKDIEALGATAAIGSLEDAHFLASTCWVLNIRNLSVNYSRQKRICRRWNSGSRLIEKLYGKKNPD